MQLLFTVSVAILCVGGQAATTPAVLGQFQGTCINADGSPKYCNVGNGVQYPGGACNDQNCVGEPCGTGVICDPRTTAAGGPGAQFCCKDADDNIIGCVDWDAAGSNCKTAGPVNRVPKCELIDAKIVSGNTDGGRAKPTGSQLTYSQILNDGYHWCPNTKKCEKLMTDATTGQASICPNWDKWVFRPATASSSTCTVGGDDMACPSDSWVGGNIASFALGVSTGGSNPSVQCGGNSGHKAQSDGGTVGSGGCAAAHLWYYRVEYPNGYEDQWEFCDSGPAPGTLTWDTDA